MAYFHVAVCRTVANNSEHWKPGVVIMPICSSLVASEFVFMTTYGATSNDILAELILGLRSANERRRYFATTSLIAWAQTYNQLCIGIMTSAGFQWMVSCMGINKFSDQYHPWRLDS